MTSVFWISLAVILYTYAGYPVIIALIARVAARPWMRAPWPLASNPAPISLIMAVHNGAAMLPDQLKHLLSLEPSLIREVIVVSDGSTDATNDILNQTQNPGHPERSAQREVEGSRSPLASHVSSNLSDTSRLRTFILPQQGGKCVAVNHGAAQATGEILLFVDIRPRIEAGALSSLLSNFADPKVGCVAGELVLATEGHDATASAVSGLYWRYEQWIRNCEAAVDSPVGVYGGFYAIRRALAVPAPPGLILDDMFQPLAIIRQGYRSVLDRQAIVTDRWPGKATGEFSRKVRTLAGNFQLVAQAPWIIGPSNRVLFQLVSHKLLRLAVPYFFVLLFVSSAVLGASSSYFAALALAQLLFWMMATVAIRYRLPVVQRIAAPASALLVLNAAAVVGLYTYLFTRGPLWRIWSPTAAPTRDEPISL